MALSEICVANCVVILNKMFSVYISVDVDCISRFN